MTVRHRAVAHEAMISKYFLGCPMWAEPSWRGSFAPRGGPVNEALAHYAAVFNTVEGNTTFYRVPDPQTVARWGAAVAAILDEIR